MVRLTVRLLGAMVVEVDGRRVPAPASRRAQALLAYLLLNPGPSSRSSLIHGLWPDLQDETRGRKQLSQELWRVRNTLDEAGAASLVENSNHFVGLATIPHRPDGSDEEIWLSTDTGAFAELIATARRAKPGSAAELSALEEAAELYVGDLLEGLFDDWLTVPRGNLRDQARLVFDRLVELRTARGLYDAARPVARRLVDLDPLSEESHRRLIRLEMLSSRPTAALAAWNACKEILELELGIEPDDETIALRDEIVRSRTSIARSPASPQVGDQARLVGRRAEIAAATVCAADFARGAATLLAIDGSWGSGKSRLLDEFCRSARVRGARIARAHGDQTDLATVRSVLSSILTPIEVRRLRTRVPDHLQGALGVLVPTVASADTRARPDESSGSRALLHAVAALCETQPLVLAIDDCHRCDDRSAELLIDIVKSIDQSRLAVAVAYRGHMVDNSSGAGRLIAAVVGSPACRQVSLGRLDRSDIAELVSATSPGIDPDAATTALETGGATTPWLVVHTLETMERAGAVVPSQIWAGHLSESVMDAVRLELADVSWPESDVLAALAGHSGITTLDELADLFPMPQSVLERACERLDRMGLVSIDTVHESGVRLVVPRLVLAALSDRRPALDGWRQPAASLVGVAEAALRAGDAVRAASAVESFLGEASTVDDRAESVLRRVLRAVALIGDLGTFERLTQQAANRLGPSGMHRLADVRAVGLIAGGRLDDATAAIEAASEGPVDPDTASRLRAAKAQTLTRRHEFVAAAAELDRAHGSQSSPATRLAILEAETDLLLASSPGDPRLVSTAERAAEFAAESGDLIAQIRFTAAAAAGLASDELDRAAAIFDPLFDQALNLSATPALGEPLVYYARCLAAAGLKGTALHELSRAFPRSNADRTEHTEMAAATAAVTVAELTGDDGRVVPLVERLEGSPFASVRQELMATRAVLALNRGHLDLTAHWLDLLAAASHDGPRPQGARAVLWRARLLRELGEFDDALSVLDELPRGTLGERRVAGAIRADLLVRMGRHDAAAQMLHGLLLRPAMGAYPELELASLHLAEAQGRHMDAMASLDRAWSELTRSYAPLDPLMDAVNAAPEVVEIVARRRAQAADGTRLVAVDARGSQHLITVEVAPGMPVDRRRTAVALAVRAARRLDATLDPRLVARVFGVSESTARRDLAAAGAAQVEL